MIASEARIQANRLNAQKSTGPRTEEGKAASRANAYKHGLTGLGVVAPDEDRAAVAELSDALHDEMRPSTALGSILVGRMAALAFRMERSGLWESAYVGERVRNAADAFDDRRGDEADAWYGQLVDPGIPADPGPLLRRLRRTPEGLSRLIQGWVDLAEAIRKPELSPWSDAHLRTFEALSGRRPTDLAPSRGALLARLIVDGDPTGLAPAEAAGLATFDAEARAAWARDRLVALITEEVDELKATYDDIDRATLELDRAGAAARALFDPSKEATLARKYEAAAERGFYRALREFQDAEAAVGAAPPFDAPAAPVPTPSPTTAASTPRGSLGSFFRDQPASPRIGPPAQPIPRSSQDERGEMRPGDAEVARPEGEEGRR